MPEAVRQRVSDTLQNRFQEKTGLRPERIFPDGIGLSLNAGGRLRLTLSAAAVAGNMQDDPGAFEGWALILKRYTEYRQLVLAWR